MRISETYKNFEPVFRKPRKNIVLGRLFRMVALRRQCDIRRCNGKPNPLFALQLKSITGYFSLVFSLYFPLFFPFYFSSAACEARKKPTPFSFLRFFRCIRLTRPCHRRRRRPPPPPLLLCLKSCSISTTPGAWSATACYLPCQDHQEIRMAPVVSH
jgi:hypothetical protein